MPESIREPRFRNNRRGRPKGRTGSDNERKWQPVRWQPLYEQFVMLSCLGVSNTDIAKRFDYTPQQVSNVLNTEKAREIQKFAVEHIRKNSMATTMQRIEMLSAKAADRIEAVLNNDELAEKSPFAIFDRSLALLRANKVVSSVGDPTAPNGSSIPGVVVNGDAVIIPSETLTKFTAAMEKLNKVNEIHGVVVGDDVGR